MLCVHASRTFVYNNTFFFIPNETASAFSLRKSPKHKNVVINIVYKQGILLVLALGASQWLKILFFESFFLVSI
jgi:hypothetical protein